MVFYEYCQVLERESESQLCDGETLWGRFVEVSVEVGGVFPEMPGIYVNAG